MLKFLLNGYIFTIYIHFFVAAGRRFRFIGTLACENKRKRTEIAKPWLQRSSVVTKIIIENEYPTSQTLQEFSDYRKRNTRSQTPQEFSVYRNEYSNSQTPQENIIRTNLFFIFTRIMVYHIKSYKIIIRIFSINFK